MGSKRSSWPSDDQMACDVETARHLSGMVGQLRKRYALDPDLVMAERCLREFQPSTSRPLTQPRSRPRPPATPSRPAAPKPGQIMADPGQHPANRPTIHEKVVEK